jgi:hypothetical protein
VVVVVLDTVMTVQVVPPQVHQVGLLLEHTRQQQVVLAVMVVVVLVEVVVDTHLVVMVVFLRVMMLGAVKVDLVARITLTLL